MASDPKWGLAEVANEDESACTVTPKVVEDIFVPESDVTLCIGGEVDSGEQVISLCVGFAQLLDDGLAEGFRAEAVHDEEEAIPFGGDVTASPDHGIKLQGEGGFLLSREVFFKMFERGFDRSIV